MTIDRPGTHFDEASHTYTTVEGEGLLGVSTVSKIGGALETWSVASKWGYKIGWQGALAVLSGDGTRPLAHAYTNDGTDQEIAWPEREDLYQALRTNGLTPWATRDKAADRGTWSHDILERLAQDNELPTAQWLAGFSDEYRGHARAVIQWYVDYRPTFVATEVQVASREHLFAGRYDIRCCINCHKLGWAYEDPHPADALCLVDLKTSKRIYPTTHFPQLAGYELASVEMGFPPTDAQFVLNTHPDGTYEFKRSWSEGTDFIAFLSALRAIKRIEAEDPEQKAKVAREQAVLANLPGLSRDLARSVPELAGMNGKGVGILLSGLRKRGLVQQVGSVWSVVSSS